MHFSVQTSLSDDDIIPGTPPSAQFSLLRKKIKSICVSKKFKIPSSKNCFEVSNQNFVKSLPNVVSDCQTREQLEITSFGNKSKFFIYIKIFCLSKI